MFNIFFGTLFANTVLVYIQDNKGWTLGYTLLTMGLMISIVIFLAGTPFYKHKVPARSPFTRMSRVIVVAFRKSKVTFPSDPKLLHEHNVEEYAKKGKFRIDYTPGMRFLNKACVKTGTNDPWMLSIVTQVEETKQMLRMILILIATFVPSTMIAQINTLFVKQGTTLDRHVGSFKIPLASITLLQRMGIGLVLHIFIMVVASLTERYRLSVTRKHEVSKIEFFYDQAPKSMKSLGISYSVLTLGVGNFISSFLLSTVSHITKKHGHGWILNNLNASHLDYYYAFFAILNFFNFLFFLFVMKFYVYKAEVSDSLHVLNEELKVMRLSADDEQEASKTRT
ncbi:hypothetical protein EZV62_000975 [Acer yangbiense]|uniref:Uncharacterized protein n=1 Tax=Acer yangbiense TaxID=1000413 RepID=A0A5C7IV62_9ROSI|nr:hypothetical protein EZV62_000975 [Acer yangbiense]